MSEIKFGVKEEDKYSIVSFEIEGVISPEDLIAIAPPKVEGSKGVILSGRGPIWLYCFLTHFYHPTKFIATYDPRLPEANTIISFLFGGLLGNVLSSWVYQKFGYLTAIVSAVVLIALVLLVIFLAIHITPWYKDRKREQLKNIIFEPLGDRYKGLIVSISRLNDAKEEIINKIDSIKDINNLEDLNKLFELRGVG